VGIGLERLQKRAIAAIVGARCSDDSDGSQVGLSSGAELCFIIAVWPGSIGHLAELVEALRIGDAHKVGVTIQLSTEAEFKEFQGIAWIQSAAEMQQFASLPSCPFSALYDQERRGPVLHADFISASEVVVGIVAPCQKDTRPGQLVIQPRQRDTERTTK